MAFSLGIDVGTSTVKAALVNIASEEVCQESHHPIGDHYVNTNVPAAREREVSQVLLALKNCMNDLESKTKLHHVRSIGVSGQMHGCVLWNDDFKLDFSFSEGSDSNIFSQSCSHFITWQDNRCDHAFLSTLPEGVAPLSTGYGCATLFWLQRYQPEVLKRFTRAGTITDLVVWGLCRGVKKTSSTSVDKSRDDAVVMSSQNATSWGYYSNGQWQKKLLSNSGFPVYLLPEVVEAPSHAGSLQEEWYGISSGTAVGVAMGDMQCSIFAARPSYSDAILSMGSASQLAVIHQAVSSEATPTDQSFETTPLPLPASVMKVPYFSGDSLLTAASLTGGNGISTLVEVLEGFMRELCVSLPSQDEIYDKLLVSAGERLDTTLSVGVTLWGERHNPELTGSVGNVTTDNLTLGDVSAATMRGVAENLYKMMPEHILQHFGITQILGTGSVLQRNPVLRHYMQQVFHRPLQVKLKADAPMGAALAVMSIS